MIVLAAWISSKFTIGMTASVSIIAYGHADLGTANVKEKLEI